MRKLKKAVGLLAGAIGLLFILGFGISSSVTTPEYAVVVVNADTKKYFAPSCTPERMKYFPKVTLAQARKLGFEPDPVCRDDGGFVQEGRSLSGTLLQALNVLSPVRSRWNSDGSWNW